MYFNNNKMETVLNLQIFMIKIIVFFDITEQSQINAMDLFTNLY